MKTIGLIGGMSWESSIEYYRIINQTVRAKLGGVHSAKSVLVSVDFAEVEALQRAGQWEEATQLLILTAQQVERAGADFILICTNTMHKMADAVQSHLHVPLLHIADATAQQVRARGLKKIGLLGTKFTMEEDFYKDRLQARHGLEVLIPPPLERDLVHRVIYDELVRGQIEPASKMRYLEIIRNLVNNGAEGIILGCTEIGLLVQAADVAVPIFDTTHIHAVAAVEYALAM